LICLIYSLLYAREDEGWFITTEIMVLTLVVVDIGGRWCLMGRKRYFAASANFMDIAAIISYTATLSIALFHHERSPHAAGIVGVFGEIIMISRNVWQIMRLK
jgi:hypothetical protein